MDNTRIRMKIGEHEFDAEGPVEIVQAQLAAFKEIISSMPHTTVVPKTDGLGKSKNNNEITPTPPHISIEKIMHVAGRVVSLTALPASSADAALLILLGHK